MNLVLALNTFPVEERRVAPMVGLWNEARQPTVSTCPWAHPAVFLPIALVISVLLEFAPVLVWRTWAPVAPLWIARASSAEKLRKVSLRRRFVAKMEKLS